MHPGMLSCCLASVMIYRAPLGNQSNGHTESLMPMFCLLLNQFGGEGLLYPLSTLHQPQTPLCLGPHFQRAYEIWRVDADAHRLQRKMREGKSERDREGEGGRERERGRETEREGVRGTEGE